MYFWKIESLKRDIENRSFTDKELIPYVVLFVGFYALASEFTVYLPYEGINYLTYLMSVLNVLIPILGTIYAYKCNGGGNGENFGLKYFSISFVVSIRFLVYAVPVMILVIAYWIVAYSEQDEIPTTFFEVTLYSGWHALYYYRVAKHVGDTVRA